VKVQGITFYPPALLRESRLRLSRSPRLSGQGLSQKTPTPCDADRPEVARSLSRGGIEWPVNRERQRAEVIQGTPELYGWVERYGFDLYEARSVTASSLVDCLV
jgi:hypothetical protein